MLIRRLIILLIALLFTFSCKKTKPHTLIHDGIQRTYYISYPKNNVDSIPLIINMHGTPSNAWQQRLYSEMDSYALPQNIAVVYPEGINKTWNVGSSDVDDIGFIDALIDTIASQYNIDLDRIYACGMSMGGYMTYELACELSHKIAAFGSVTGTFIHNENQLCKINRKVPIIHFHGTSDEYVLYGDSTSSFSDTVESSINFWIDRNDASLSSIDTLDNQSDKTYVEKYVYTDELDSVEIVHFKVINGGHQWFGSKTGNLIQWIVGNNNHDINTNEELIKFFLNYKLHNI